MCVCAARRAFIMIMFVLCSKWITAIHFPNAFLCHILLCARYYYYCYYYCVRFATTMLQFAMYKMCVRARGAARSMFVRMQFGRLSGCARCACEQLLGKCQIEKQMRTRRMSQTKIGIGRWTSGWAKLSATFTQCLLHSVRHSQLNEISFNSMLTLESCLNVILWQSMTNESNITTWSVVVPLYQKHQRTMIFRRPDNVLQNSPSHRRRFIRR